MVGKAVNIEGEKVKFDNTPFMISRTQKFDCQFGNHYYKQKQQSSKQTHLQVTQKLGCTACVTVFSITLYPEFHIGKEDFGSVMQTTETEKERKYFFSYVIPLPIANHYS